MRPFALAFAIAMALTAGQAMAQPLAQSGVYATLGYSRLDGDQLALNLVGGRLGYRFGRYFAVEGEVNTGVGRDSFIFDPCPNPACLMPVFLVTARLQDAEAAYAVGLLPITRRADVFARVGYGTARYSTKGSFGGFRQGGLDLGAGAQYFIGPRDGLRVDYTRHFIENDNSPLGPQAVGDGADAWSAAFIHRF
jgi:hypothetical protein